MQIEYTGRHTTITAKQKAQAEAGLERLSPMMERACSAHVILTVDKYRQMAEITTLCPGQTLVATGEANEMETAIHDALAKLEQQWVRHSQKQSTMRRHPKEDIKRAELEPEDVAAG